MTRSQQDIRNYSILGVFFAALAFYLYSQLSTPDTPPPVTTVVTTPAATPHVTGSTTRTVPATQLDPTLHMEAMLVTESLVYSGSGRNIFSPNSAPEVVIPKVVAAVRIPQTIAPVRTEPSGPPPPPPIDLKFFGTETAASGARRAFLLHGEDVFLVSSGDIVQRRYRVLSIEARSIFVEDIANANRQTLPLIAN